TRRPYAVRSDAEAHHREIHFGIEEGTGRRRGMDLRRAYSCALECCQRFLEPSKLRLREGRIKRVFDVCEMRVCAFDFERRQLSNFFGERLKITGGDALPV